MASNDNRDISDELPEQSDVVDTWAAVLPGQSLIPAYLVAKYASQYRVIVDVLLAAQDTTLTGMSFDGVDQAVRRRIRGILATETADRLLDDSAFVVEARLSRLVSWGVITRWQEPARTGEDFLRRRDRYQLTPLAARLHAFWLAADEAEEEAGDLTLAPRAIHDRLIAFAAAIRDKHFPVAAGEYQQIIALHHAMARAARSWQRVLAHNLSGVPDEAKQELVWRTLRAYISMWGEQVDIFSPQIAKLLSEVTPDLSPGGWRACALGALSEDAADSVITAQADRWAQTWEALREWFGGPDGQARRLRRQLRDVVTPWARNTRMLMDAGGAVTRSAELIGLAVAIESAADDEDAWRIWDTAVGGFPARHLLLTPGRAEDDGLSWEEAPAVPVTARYREQGPRAMTGRRPKRADFSKGRSAARQARLAGLAERAQAEAALRQRSGTRLSEWPDLGRAEFDLLLDLLGTARRAGPKEPGRGNAYEALTEDGRWLVRIREPSERSATATLNGPDGRMVTVDWHFELEWVA
ncbi:DUF2397 domain-containing protein [Nonomuraea typhae]|uniref:DUF2397 domain-containing protein n=1 Tax=Nonomuraea typhae TaxID=2603600 RepID=UPI0012FC4D1F|nr:DUF2397 domain-containing protein [Nonomuraea typhae]